MSRRNVVSFYTAPARSGKTFRMVVRICDEILPLTDGAIYTNLPLHPDLIAEYCHAKHSLPVEVTLSRLHIISRETEREWRDAGKPQLDGQGRKIGVNPNDGPWEYFADKPLSGSTIIIDEIHNFCGSIGTPKSVSNSWQKWLGELGHNQAVFICISQAPEKVHACIKQEAQASYVIRNTGLDRDPFFKIEVYDWLELFSGLFGMRYRVFVFEQEIQKVEGKKVSGQRRLHLMGEPYFSFYDSFNCPISNTQTENVTAFEHEYEKHLRKGPIAGRLSLLRWFCFKNLQPLLSRGLMALAMTGVLLYFLTGGAGDVCVYITSAFSGSFKAPSIEGKENPSAESSRSCDADIPDYQKREKIIREYYESELRKSLLDNASLQKSVNSLEDEFRRLHSVVLMTRDSIVLKRGLVYYVGEKINRGEYEGRVLESIDYLRREALLDDGSVLCLYGGGLSGEKE